MCFLTVGIIFLGRGGPSTFASPFERDSASNPKNAPFPIVFFKVWAAGFKT